MRWTEDDVKDFQKRQEASGVRITVRTHLLDPAATRAAPANKRGGRSKYGNVKVEAEGMKFDSRREKTRWMALRLEETTGAITNLQRQITYPLDVNGMKVCDYIADFVYERGGELVVEDAKGFRTAIYQLKAKLMLAVHGIKVFES